MVIRQFPYSFWKPHIIIPPRDPYNTPFTDTSNPSAGDRPWYVEFSDGGTFLGCSGVILDEHYVLTSAAAVDTLFAAGSPTLFAGGVDPFDPAEPNEEAITPDSGVTHPNWTGVPNDGYDIGLVYSSAGWSSFGTYIYPIPYAGVDEGNYPVGYELGWDGELKWNSGAVDAIEVMTEGLGTRISESTANTAYGGSFTVDSTQIAMQHSTKVWQDYGTGLIAYDGSTFYVAGLMSFPVQLGVQDISVWTKIANYNSWIFNETGLLPFF